MQRLRAAALVGGDYSKQYCMKILLLRYLEVKKKHRRRRACTLFANQSRLLELQATT